ncbi:hypothetical protein ASPWEDRAFT_33807 [Aspergillus wentii DTO 134E9]|uniref:TPR domain protein n=1 Tax=Aspergillus wentii DTO 134E9 TaxID=1073089 RepID=A0A1L9RZQ7_ASPWE|nr:uncharacterized protein ASPWEDRAFT_33807 [Aspergillus wentii DTO 134E9]OJJ40419.1 hypothetical protein ASPWEDRAFT_33807 [Aspergillus wentii DTO 134E9]
MFSAAARRVSASAPKALRYNQSLNRSISSGTRPAIHSRFGRTNPQQSSFPLLTRYARSQTRNISFSQRMKLGFREASKGIWRKNPILLPLAIISTIGAALIFTYIAFVEVVYVGPQYQKFPPPVADALRTAVYYTDIDLNPHKALKAYKDALKIANEMGMHPFSDEVLGIKIAVSKMLEDAGLMKPAIEVLERTKKETQKWIEDGRKKNETVKEEAQDKKAETEPKSTIQINDPEILATEERLRQLEEYENLQRDKALKKVVGMQMHLAELYSSDYIQDEKKAEESLVAAVELSLKELRRRESLGLPIGGGLETEDQSTWLNRTEIAAALQDLGFTYVKQEKYELAIPLCMRSLELVRIEEGNSPSCKQVILLNGIATAMGAQVTNKWRPQPGITKDQAIEAAKQWCKKTIEVDSKIDKSIKDGFCDLGCAAAKYNLGELFEAQNKLGEARKYFDESKRMFEKFQDGEGEEGLMVSKDGLKRITKKEKEQKEHKAQ